MRVHLATRRVDALRVVERQTRGARRVAERRASKGADDNGERDAVVAQSAQEADVQLVAALVVGGKLERVGRRRDACEVGRHRGARDGGGGGVDRVQQVQIVAIGHVQHPTRVHGLEHSADAPVGKAQLVSGYVAMTTAPGSVGTCVPALKHFAASYTTNPVIVPKMAPPTNTARTTIKIPTQMRQTQLSFESRRENFDSGILACIF